MDENMKIRYNIFTSIPMMVVGHYTFLHYTLSFGISLVTTQTTCRLTELTISISATRNGKITVLLNGEKAMSKLEHMKMQRIFGKLFRRLNGKSGLNGTNLKNKNFATFFWDVSFPK